MSKQTTGLGSRKAGGYEPVNLFAGMNLAAAPSEQPPAQQTAAPVTTPQPAAQQTPTPQPQQPQAQSSGLPGLFSGLSMGTPQTTTTAVASPGPQSIMTAENASQNQTSQNATAPTPATPQASNAMPSLFSGLSFNNAPPTPSAGTSGIGGGDIFSQLNVKSSIGAKPSQTTTTAPTQTTVAPTQAQVEQIPQPAPVAAPQAEESTPQRQSSAFGLAIPPPPGTLKQTQPMQMPGPPATQPMGSGQQLQQQKVGEDDDPFADVIPAQQPAKSQNQDLKAITQKEEKQKKGGFLSSAFGFLGYGGKDTGSSSSAQKNDKKGPNKNQNNGPNEQAIASQISQSQAVVSQQPIAQVSQDPVVIIEPEPQQESQNQIPNQSQQQTSNDQPAPSMFGFLNVKGQEPTVPDNTTLPQQADLPAQEIPAQPIVKPQQAPPSEDGPLMIPQYDDPSRQASMTSIKSHNPADDFVEVVESRDVIEDKLFKTKLVCIQFTLKQHDLSEQIKTIEQDIDKLASEIEQVQQEQIQAAERDDFEWASELDSKIGGLKGLSNGKMNKIRSLQFDQTILKITIFV